MADELDEYVDDHVSKFASYEPEGEQQLGWHGVHLQYVSLVGAPCPLAPLHLHPQPEAIRA